MTRDGTHKCQRNVAWLGVLPCRGRNVAQSQAEGLKRLGLGFRFAAGDGACVMINSHVRKPEGEKEFH